MRSWETMRRQLVEAARLTSGFSGAKPRILIRRMTLHQQNQDEPRTCELPNRERDVTIARETDIFLEVRLRRLASAGRFRRGAADGPRTKDRIKMSDRPSHNLAGLDIDHGPPHR